ncbi:MAG: hypothetical protein ACE5HL_10060, partial [Terriglobia bacterium]
YTYDGENRITHLDGATDPNYYYDGSGLRVKKVAGATTTLCVFSGIKVIPEYAAGADPASPTKEYVYSGTQLLATEQPSGTTYHHSGHLSVRVTTDVAGTVVAQRGHYPFGESWYQSGTTTPFIFTSYLRDLNIALDYGVNRF